ncbi:MAG: DUF58 domain-containing protein [Planctomycetota bacterium]
MPSFSHPYLDLKRMEMLRRVRLKPRGVAEGSLAGPHRSNYRGTAVEFADFRDYVHGDDIRLLDWKLHARTDKYYIRLYEAERNLLGYLVCDTSGSMGFAGAVTRTQSKLEYAGRLAAAIAYLVIDGGDQAGLSLARTEVDDHLPPRAGFQHLARMVRRLGETEAAGGTDLGACLRGVYRRIRQRGVLIVLSDFLDDSEGLWQGIDLFRQSQFDVMLFHIVHPEEIELPDVPTARFLPCEGEGGAFTVEPDVLRDLYRRRFAQHLNGVEGAARKRGCDWFLARTDTDPYLLLKQSFLARQVV